MNGSTASPAAREHLGTHPAHHCHMGMKHAGRSQASSSTLPASGCSGNMDASTYCLTEIYPQVICFCSQKLWMASWKQLDCPLRLHNFTDITEVTLHGKMNVPFFSLYWLSSKSAKILKIASKFHFKKPPFRLWNTTEEIFGVYGYMDLVRHWQGAYFFSSQ